MIVSQGLKCACYMMPKIAWKGHIFEYFTTGLKKLCVCVSGGKKCSFFEKFDMLCFLVTPVLRFPFALLPTKYQTSVFLLYLELGLKSKPDIIFM